ncbi:IMP dehydrogenase [Patescibacteria group bacterium]|nr:IMP dehydrogenase [Patescibacteria group bacterium]
MFNNLQETFTFDDILMVPQKSSILPKDAILQTKLTSEIILNLPFLSAPMDTVTEGQMAIYLALHGGMGIIHKNLSIDEQIREVKKVKRFENGFVQNPVTIGPTDLVDDVFRIKKEKGFKKIPVVDENGILVGLITDSDYLITFDKGRQVHELMTPLSKLAIGCEGMLLDEANMMIRDHRIKVLPVVNNEGKLVSIVSRSDLEKNEDFPLATKTKSKQLCVGAAVGVGRAGLERVEALLSVGVDVVCVDTAHGHSEGVIDTVRMLRQRYSDLQIIAGNIVTAEAAKELMEAGVSAVKVGVGPGSICTTRVVSATGVPQVSAVREVKKAMTEERSVPIIADGGIKTSGDIVKALGIGADVVMMGNIFAGTDESPGRVEYRGGRMYKRYRGMGSLEAMEHGSKDRYGQADTKEKEKFVPEGVSGLVAYKGPVERIIYQLAGGLRSGMGYCGARTIEELQENAVFIRISNAGLKESHPHDLSSFKSAPNYVVGEE